MSGLPPGGAQMQAGDELPTVHIQMTATRIVAGAVATRDFMPVHHDRDYARSQGAPDIFMNILSTNAYCQRYLTDWAGPDAMVKRLDIRLGVPVFPTSDLTFSGSITSVQGGTVEVALRASTDLGDHASGTATVSIQ